MKGQVGQAGSSEIDVHDETIGHALVGQAPVFQVTCSIAQRVARRRSTVMILGETGTGKEVLARYTHAHSDRADGPFVPVDCSSISHALFESELFGHVKGAFTGATRDSVGFIRAADGGTLFLDEVGELDLALQAKLLRVLQERRVTPVGDTCSYPVDVRVICATHRDLPAMVRQQTFRQDLFFRLNVVTLHVPPLRERRDDILPLAQHFLQLQADIYCEPCKRLAPDAADALCAYDWPGNVRELGNVIEHAHVLAPTLLIGASELPASLPRPRAGVALATRTLPRGARTLDDVERQTIAAALKEADYCKAAASRALGVHIQRLNRLIAKLEIPVA
jgi:transcriptional regulator with PAS, ATPase and Fis domain